MSFKFNVKKTLGALVILLAANQSIPGLYYSRKLGKVLSPNTPKIVVRDYCVDRLSHLPRDLYVIDYLNIASSVVHNGASHSVAPDCKDFSQAVFSTFLMLVDVNGRRDLSDQVRVCADFRKVGGPQDGHVWLEYKTSQGYVFPYETTSYTPILSGSNVKSYSLQSAGIKSTLAGLPEHDVADCVVARTFWGSTMPYPTLDSFVKKKGLLGFLLGNDD